MRLGSYWITKFQTPRCVKEKKKQSSISFSHFKRDFILYMLLNLFVCDPEFETSSMVKQVMHSKVQI